MDSGAIVTKEATQRDRRSCATRARIVRATVGCLDELGHSETTFARVQERAGLSRGAITHHFPTRQDLISATAMQLLGNALAPFERRRDDPSDSATPVQDMILRAWDRVANSAGGRAMLEILVACRTDADLRRELRDRLRDWDRASLASIAETFSGAGPDPDDAEVLWSICRTFIRGLLIHEQFVASPEYLTRMVHRFAGLMELQLRPLGPTGKGV